MARHAATFATIPATPARLPVLIKTGTTDGIYNDVIWALRHVPTVIKKELKEWAASSSSA